MPRQTRNAIFEADNTVGLTYSGAVILAELMFEEPCYINALKASGAGKSEVFAVHYGRHRVPQATAVMLLLMHRMWRYHLQLPAALDGTFPLKDVASAPPKLAPLPTPRGPDIIILDDVSSGVWPTPDDWDEMAKAERLTDDPVYQTKRHPEEGW